MKRNACIAALLACVACGAVRLWDLCANSEAETGFVTQGSVWLRYGILAAFVVAVCMLARVCTAKTPLDSFALPVPPVFALLAAAALGSGMIALQYAVNEFTYPTTSLGRLESGAGLMLFALVLRLTFGISLLLLSAWCAVLCLREAPLQPQAGAVRVLGFLAVIGLFILPVLRYAENPASVHRILRILPICAALSAMVFGVKLLGVFCVSLSAERRRTTAVAGVCAFLLCTCIGLPQLLWQVAQGGATLLQAWVTVTLALLGVIGAFTALAVSEA